MILLLFLAGYDAEEAEAQNQAAQHGALGEPPARLGHALRGSGGSGTRRRRRHRGGRPGEAAAAQRAASETANAVRYDYGVYGYGVYGWREVEGHSSSSPQSDFAPL